MVVLPPFSIFSPKDLQFRFGPDGKAEHVLFDLGMLGVRGGLRCRPWCMPTAPWPGPSDHLLFRSQIGWSGQVKRAVTKLLFKFSLVTNK